MPRPGQANFAFVGEVKMEVWWPGGQVKIASVSRQVASDNLQSKIISKLKAAR